MTLPGIIDVGLIALLRQNDFKCVIAVTFLLVSTPLQA